MKIYLILLLLCGTIIHIGWKKDNTEILSGTWTVQMAVPEGVMKTELRFNESGRYTINSMITSKNRSNTMVAPEAQGTYSLKREGFFFRNDGSNFDWAVNGKVNGKILTLQQIFGKGKLVFKQSKDL